jgi:hypothetical protein
MRKLVLFAVLLISIEHVTGQKSIDRLFEKYSGKDGFTTVTISGDLLKLAARLDNDKDEGSSFPATITEIRILTRDDDDLITDNFYSEVMKDINLNDYEEFMRVKESNQDLRMLIRAEGNKIKEFLFVAGGEKDNAIIQVKGMMTFSEARKISEKMKKHNKVEISALHN